MQAVNINQADYQLSFYFVVGKVARFSLTLSDFVSKQTTNKSSLTVTAEVGSSRRFFLTGPNKIKS